MRKFGFETWDDGHVTVNAEFAGSLRAGGLLAFTDFMQNDTGEVAKNLLKERTTVRISLPGRDGRQTDFFLKRHRNTPLREYVKPWLRLTRPIIGARNEWNAILAFHEAGIPTMTPVALGERGRESFLLTEGIPDCVKLSDWMHRRFDPAHAQIVPKPHLGTAHADDRELPDIVDEVADMARRMHEHRLHHQDFYLTHLLMPVDRRRGIHVIDLGRARARRRLSRRWIVKDLAQLNYSAHLFPAEARERFLERYLGRASQPRDRRLIAQIERKTARIARHSKKHAL